MVDDILLHNFYEDLHIKLERRGLNLNPQSHTNINTWAEFTVSRNLCSLLFLHAQNSNTTYLCTFLVCSPLRLVGISKRRHTTYTPRL